MSQLSQEFEPESGVLPEGGHETKWALVERDEADSEEGGGSAGGGGAVRVADDSESEGSGEYIDVSIGSLTSEDSDLEMGGGREHREDEFREASEADLASEGFLLPRESKEERLSARFSEPPRTARRLAGGDLGRHRPLRRVRLRHLGSGEERDTPFWQIRGGTRADEPAAPRDFREPSTGRDTPIPGSVGHSEDSTEDWAEETDGFSVRTEEPEEDE